jgi:hypothetical protein
LQNIPEHFQGLTTRVGSSMRHARDITACHSPTKLMALGGLWAGSAGL